jgi:uncharacterized protein (TIGR02217 family)
MSSNVFPTIPGLTFGNKRTPTFNTGVQQALSGKESRIAYQLYPLITFELQFELLRDTITPSELKSLTGLFMACQGQYDTFLFSDPSFNTVTAQQFGTGDGATTNFQITAIYQNTGGPGIAEIIQNFNGAPAISVNGTLQTLGTAYTLGATGIVTFLGGHIPAAAAVITWTGSFYYRCRFTDDTLENEEFMNNWWQNTKVSFKQVKL